MPINPKSSWPFTPFLVANVVSIEELVKKGAPKKPLVLKTIERFFRAGARVMEHYAIPADLVLSIAREQILREGGPAAKTSLAAQATQASLHALQTAKEVEGVVAGWLQQAAVPEQPKDVPGDSKE
jgi:hypothetical protein